MGSVCVRRPGMELSERYDTVSRSGKPYRNDAFIDFEIKMDSRCP